MKIERIILILGLNTCILFTLILLLIIYYNVLMTSLQLAFEKLRKFEEK